jgi:hypothetical protein
MSDASSLAVPMPSESERWNSWRAKGHAADARFRRRLRTAAIDVAATVALAGAMWFAFHIGS